MGTLLALSVHLNVHVRGLILLLLRMTCVLRSMHEMPQACYDGAMAMNARGQGVQLKRAECFTHACRALWPGNEELDSSVVEAFSS